MTAHSQTHCARCGSALSADSLGGLCPNCVGRRMFGSGADHEMAALGTKKPTPNQEVPEFAPLPLDLKPGDVVGRYRLRERIGEGGFAVVFGAEQFEPVKREVAFKVVKLGMDTHQVIARFEAERQALALMDHPNIAKVLDGGATENGRPYFVMELVHGMPITTFCDQHEWSIKERLQIFVQVCHAIQHAHQKGIIHRDIKPSNVLVAANASPTDKAKRIGSFGRAEVDSKEHVGSGWKETPSPGGQHVSRYHPMVIDFGIAKATQMELTERTIFTQLHHFVGTPAYMSPEQVVISAADVDTRSDIYSLGILLYELLTGSPPFEEQELVKGDYEALRRIIQEKDPVRPSTYLRTRLQEDLAILAKQQRTSASNLAHLIKGDLDWIVMKCLEKDRTRRYATANGLARDVERHLGNEPIVARPPSLAYRTHKFVRRNRLAVTATAAVFVTLLAGIILTSIGFIRANRQRQRADQEATNVRTVSYGANLRSAIYLNDIVGNGGRALQSLADCPSELRDWEWNFVQSRCSQSHRLIAQGLEDIRNAVFTPDGTKVISCRQNGLYQLWDFQTGRELGRLPMTPPKPGDRPSSLALAHGPRFTPDGEKAVLFDPSKIVVWDLASGESIQTFTNLSPMAVHVGQQELLSVGWLGGNREDPVIWDHVSNRLRRRLNASLGNDLNFCLDRLPEDALGVSFTPDGKELMLGQGAGTFLGHNTWIDFWNVSSGDRDRRITTAHFFCMYAASIDQNHQRLATACTDDYAKVFDLSAPASAGPAYEFQTQSALRAVALSHDGKRLAAGGTGTKILIWDLSSTSNHQEPERLSGHASTVLSLQFSQDDRWILSTSLDGTVRAWESEPFRLASFYLVYQLAEQVVFSPDGRRLVSIGREGQVKLWDAATGRELATLGETGVPIQAVSYSPDGSNLAMLEKESGRVTLWNTSTWQPRLVVQEPPRNLLSIEFAGPYLGGIAWGNRVYFWDANDGTLKIQYSLVETNAAVRAVAISADGQLAAVSFNSSPGEVQLYDLMSGKLRQVLQGPNSIVYALAFGADAAHVAAGFADTTVALWDLPSGLLTHRLRGHTEPVKCVAFSPSGKRLLSGGADDSLRIWKFDTEEELMSLPLPEGGDVERMRFSPDGRTLVAINTFYPPWFFQSYLPDEEVRQARRKVGQASRTVWRLSNRYQSSEQVAEVLREDSELEPEVKTMALDIMRSRLRWESQLGDP